MVRSNHTRDDIVQHGTALIGRNGFHNTGLDAVLKASGVPKGSFYHYFGSKEEFGLAVIDEFAKSYEAKLDHFLNDQPGSALTRLKRLFTHTADNYCSEACARGCLIGTLGQEMAAQHERFREHIDAIFKRWEARFAGALETAKQEGELAKESDAAMLAKVLLAGYEGASLRAKVTHSVQPLKDFVTVYFDRVLK